MNKSLKAKIYLAQPVCKAFVFQKFTNLKKSYSISVDCTQKIKDFQGDTKIAGRNHVNQQNANTHREKYNIRVD